MGVDAEGAKESRGSEDSAGVGAGDATPGVGGGTVGASVGVTDSKGSDDVGTKDSRRGAVDGAKESIASAVEGADDCPEANGAQMATKVAAVKQIFMVEVQ